MKRIAVFASGSGSNFQAITEAARKGRLDAEIALLVCDKPDAFVLKRAEKENVPAFCAVPKAFPNKTAYETAVLQQLKNKKIDRIVLAGYMRLIGPVLLNGYSGRIVNIHPSLLPAFPGRDAVGQAMEAGVKITGVTIHYVDEGMDTGQIIAQQPVVIRTGDTADAVQQRIQQVEHQLYPAVLQKLLQEKQNLEGETCQNER